MVGLGLGVQKEQEPCEWAQYSPDIPVFSVLVKHPLPGDTGSPSSM